MKGSLHHVSVVTRDLDRSVAFYTGRLGFTRIARPDFPVAGAWLSAGGVELHLIVHPAGHTRSTGTIDGDDNHFAIRVADFDATLAGLRAAGFREGPEAGEGLAMLVRRASKAGYGQIYICDPDHHIIEINAPV